MAFRIPPAMNVYRRPHPVVGLMGNHEVGYFVIPMRRLTVIAVTGEGWDHVSASTPDRCPTYEELQWLKEQFWDAEDTVIQIHPPASQYVNNHPYTLHLWRKLGFEQPLPPKEFV